MKILLVSALLVGCSIGISFGQEGNQSKTQLEPVNTVSRTEKKALNENGEVREFPQKMVIYKINSMEGDSISYRNKEEFDTKMEIKALPEEKK